MGKKKITPEEQLLELIEKGSRLEAVGIGKRRRGLGALGDIGRFLGFLKRWLVKATGKTKKTLRQPNLKTINSLLLILCVVLIVFSVADFILTETNIERVYKRARKEKYKELKEEKKIIPRSFLYYLEMVQRRNIFSPIALAREKEVKKEIKKEDLVKITANFNLVGISWGAEPTAMVEDKADKKTYFLKRGDEIKRFRVKDILEDRVILLYDGNELELM